MLRIIMDILLEDDRTKETKALFFLLEIERDESEK